MTTLTRQASPYLCVGAVSRRVVEEAACLGVTQIVASRRQVDIDGGYVGLDQYELVDLVRSLSRSLTRVVRDHGGPNRGARPDADDGVTSLEVDVDAGFDGLHLDVCEIPRADQVEILNALVDRFTGRAWLEVGGEHEDHNWNLHLLESIPHHRERIDTLVMGAGTHIFNDRQVGHVDPALFRRTTTAKAIHGVTRTKLHNADWLGYAEWSNLASAVDLINVAPEVAQVEVDAILTCLGRAAAHRLLNVAYDSGAWRRWFEDDQGDWFEHARCAVRYVLNTHVADELGLGDEDDKWIRRCIREHIVAL